MAAILSDPEAMGKVLDQVMGYEAAPSTVVAISRHAELERQKRDLEEQTDRAFQRKEEARAEVDRLTADLPESVKVEILLAASVYAERLAAYVRARDKLEAMFPRLA